LERPNRLRETGQVASRRTVVLAASLLLVGCTAEAPPDSPAAPTAGAVEVYRSDWSGHDFSRWTTCQNRQYDGPCSGYDGRFYGASIRDSGRAGHGAAVRFEVRDGDVPDFGGGERSELALHGDGDVREGDERWYRVSWRFDEDFPVPTGNFCLIMQWHSGHGSPPLAINVNGRGRLELVNNVIDGYDRDIGPIQRGRWVQYLLHVRFSNDPEQGGAEVWVDGELAVPWTSRPTMNSEANFLKTGIYRARSDATTAVLWQDDLVIIRD
jgi:hypothetical protein